jgi:hypothetical protein
MDMHDNKQCKKKCECVMGVLSEIQSLLEYPRSDREQQVKCAIDIALQDIQYLNHEMETEEPNGTGV